MVHNHGKGGSRGGAGVSRQAKRQAGKAGEAVREWGYMPMGYPHKQAREKRSR